MATVTFILGYCGSGKTHLADEMVRDRGVVKFDEGFLNDPGQHAALIDALKQGRDCVVIEIEYCVPSSRDAIVAELKRAVPNVVVEVIYFEADLAKANANCWRRKNKEDPEGHIWINSVRIGQRYTIPPGAAVLKIFELPAA
jgi:hypothetical protein